MLRRPLLVATPRWSHHQYYRYGRTYLPAVAIRLSIPSGRHRYVKTGPPIISKSIGTRFLSSHVSAFNCDAHTHNNEYAILSLPLRYLREMDASGFDPTTYQRCNVQYDSETGKPILQQDGMYPARLERRKMFAISSCSFDEPQNVYRIVWDDGLESQYTRQWVDQELSKWRGYGDNDDNAIINNNQHMARITLWTNLTEQIVRNSDLSLSFRDAVLTDEGMSCALKALYQYGICLVKDTPIHDGGEGVAALAAALGGGSLKNDNPTSLLRHYRQRHNPSSSSSLSSTDNEEATSPTPKAPSIMLPFGTDGPLRTLYGTVWSTTCSGQQDGASVADSAYGQEGLPLHTDMTYQRDPPGLQIFTMAQPAVKGGESVFGDGFAIAERLRTTHPEAFDTLSQTARRYRCIDKATGWHLEAHGPVIEVRDHANKQIVGIRHNDLDRLPDLPPPGYSPQEIEVFYDKVEWAHEAWDELIASDEFRLVMPLQAGDTMVVANHRCLHGRYAFETTIGVPRAVIGCYMSQDELYSRFRQEGFVVP